MRLVLLMLLAMLALPASAQAPADPLAPAVTAPEPVRRGYYLARMGDCISCHTAPGGKPFAGGLRMDTPFGPMLSANITPDPATGIGHWSADDLWRALHKGENKAGQYLFPVMPYTFTTKVTRADSDALYAYLKTVPAVHQAVQTNQLWFPFNIRLAQLVWRELFFTEGVFQPDPTRSADWNRGAYLVEGLGHCGACHSPRNFLGGIEAGRRFTGGMVDGWVAPNLTHDLRLGLGRFTLDELATWLRQGEAVAPATPRDLTASNAFTPGPLPSAVGPMAEVVHNSLRFLTPPDARAMATYLLALPAASGLAGAAPPAGRNPLGAQLYGEMCAACHGPAGGGIVGLAPRLAENPVVAAPSPDDVLRMVLGGQAAHHQMGPMPAFGRMLTDAQVAALASFVRGRWGNAAAPVTAGMVAAYRAGMPQGR